MADDGKAYGSSASTAKAWGSSTDDTNLASLLLILIAKRSILPGRRPEGGTTLFELSGLSWRACLLHSGGLECFGL